MNKAAQRTDLPGCEAASEGRQVCSGNPAAVGLGLLCVLLLAVIVSLSIKHNAEIQQIQNSYTNLTLQRNQLIETYDTVNMEKGALQKKLTEMESACPIGWLKFMCSCYYVSPTGNTWNGGRQDCRAKGADLVIINSREEQMFVSGLGKTLWIGLTDQAEEGSWKWVDDTLLLSGYWKQGELNNINYGDADEDCVQIVPLISIFSTLANWNDVKCSGSLSWICEKRVAQG